MNPKYTYPEAIAIENRQWPDRVFTQPPVWTSVDLRDGNQALPEPMNPNQKLEYFNMLKKIGFKEIEVSFPGEKPACVFFWDTTNNAGSCEPIFRARALEAGESCEFEISVKHIAL